MARVHTWPLDDAARAARMKGRTLQQWKTTGVLPLQGNDRKSTGHGDRSGYSRPRIVQAAITQQLNLHGVSVSRAAKAAFEFTDRGNTDRAPCEVFEVGKTILMVKPDGATLINIFADTSYSDVSNSACVISVCVNEVIEQVDAVLNIS
jgi:hypothetical protein